MSTKITDKLIFIDTETGGVDPSKHSLLSVALVAWDKSCGVIDSMEILIKHDLYCVTATANDINKFDENKHNKEAIPGPAAIGKIEAFCEKHFPKGILVQLAGHNTQFDVNFLKQLYKQCNRSYEKVYSHRILDTYSLLCYLYYKGELENMELLSSSKAFSHFGIQCASRHTAIDDALCTAELFERILAM